MLTSTEISNYDYYTFLMKKPEPYLNVSIKRPSDSIIEPFSLDISL